MDFNRSYNQRLFEDNAIRRYLHNGRFRWFKAKCQQYHVGDMRMIELGCFDGRLIDFCPVSPVHYEGYDAGWEGGLEIAMKKFNGRPDRIVRRALEPKDISHIANASFNVGAAMETLEHVPPELLGDYLNEMSRVIDGHFFVTVPNEKGFVFLTKYMVKAFLGSNQKYTPTEVLNATLGRLAKVPRDDHKGFDYDVLINQLREFFDVVEVEPIPFKLLPRSLGFTIGIVARTRRQVKTRHVASVVD